MLFSDSGDTKHKLCFLGTEINAFRILHHRDGCLLYSSLCLCCSVRDGYSHSHVCADHAFSFLHGINISRFNCSACNQEFSCLADSFFLSYGRLIQKDAVLYDNVFLYALFSCCNCLFDIIFWLFLCRSIKSCQLQIKCIQCRVVQEVLDSHELCLWCGLRAVPVVRTSSHAPAE